MERARDLDITGRASMTKQDLLDAIDAATDENGRAKGSTAALEQKTKDDLYAMAQNQDIEGRSSMSKSDLVKALAKDA